MRVLMLSLDRGLLGAGSSGDTLARHKKYADLCGELDIIVFSPKAPAEQRIAPNLRVIPSGSRKLLHWRRAAKLAVYLHHERPYDLLVTQDFAAPAGERIKKNLRLPWIVSIHGMFFSTEWLKFNPLQWYLFYRVKKALRLADGFRVNNKTIKNKLRSWGIAKPVLVQPTAIDVRPFLSREKPVNPVPHLLFVGRLSREKNISLLIRAASDLKQQFELQIVGGGPDGHRLAKLAGGDQRIKFLGSKTMAELPAIYREADIFVLPSDTETFGQVLLQAAAAGCAIVATKTAGASSVLQDGQTGLLVDVRDQAGLTKALGRLFADAALCKQLGKNARQMAEQYNADAAVERLINFWKEVARK